MKIFLIGMMGAGKSYWKQRLAKKMKVGGYDLDFIIESHEEKTISEIFSEDGEAYFRETEANMLRWFKEKKAFVLATGGGTPCFYHNMEWMKEQGLTIWLDEPVEVIAKRLIPEKEHRPLIRQLSDVQLEDYLAQKLKERRTFYQQAACHITGTELNDATMAKIIKQYA